MAAEREHDTLTIVRPSHLEALERRRVPPPREDVDLDDGETEVEDSGAGSFLDRFSPPLAPRQR